MPMEDLKSVTVGYLRGLARKHLGAGYSRMKKEELLAALAAYVPALVRLARLAGRRLPRKRTFSRPVQPSAELSVSNAPRAAPDRPPEQPKAPAAAKADDVTPPDKGSVSAPRRVAAKRASEKPGSKPSARPATVVTFPPRPRAERAREPVTPVVPSFTRAVAPSPNGDAVPTVPPASVQQPAEPVVEGFFVARVAGEDEARHHHMVGRSPVGASVSEPKDPEGLGALPSAYEDDTVLLLPRDPQTLFVSWDFSPGTRLLAEGGLEAPRPVLRVFDGEQLVRELGFAMEASGFYIQGMTPGRTYRVEAHVVGKDGRSRRIGASSNRVTLPPSGVSSDHTVRFLRVPPVESPALTPAAHELPDEEREYISWRRVNLPGSGGVFDLPEVRRERRRAVKREAHLEGVERAPGASDQRYVASLARAPGASDQRYLGASDQRYLADAVLRSVRGPGPSPVPRYLEMPSRAPGASDQRYAEGLVGQGGLGPASRTYLDVRGVPGASDLRYPEQPPGLLGQAEQRYLGHVARPPGASDQRYVAASPGSLDHRYLDVRQDAAGASELRYLETPGRASVASDRRYLEALARASETSDGRYPGEVSGASASRGLGEGPARRNGTAAAGDAQASWRSVDAESRRPSSTDAPRPAGAGAHATGTPENHSSVDAHERSHGGASPSSEGAPSRATDAEENHRYFEVPARPSGSRDARRGAPRVQGGEGAAHAPDLARRPGGHATPAAGTEAHTHEASGAFGAAPREAPVSLPRKTPSGDGRS